MVDDDETTILQALRRRVIDDRSGEKWLFDHKSTLVLIGRGREGTDESVARGNDRVGPL